MQRNKILQFILFNFSRYNFFFLNREGFFVIFTFGGFCQVFAFCESLSRSRESYKVVSYFFLD